jgi:peroxiredoxin
MRAWKICPVLFLAASLALAQKAANVEAAEAKALGLSGKSAPDFTLPDMQGKSFHLAGQRGKLQKELASEGVVVAPIAFDDAENARNVLSKKKIDAWSLLDERAKGGPVAALYGAHFLPKTFVIGRDGTVVKAIVRKTSEAELRSAIAAAQR